MTEQGEKKETRVFRFLKLIGLTPKDCSLKFVGKTTDEKAFYCIESQTLPKETIERVNEKLKNI